MIKLVTFTDPRMTISASKLVESAMQYGCDSYSLWNERDLPEWLYRMHPEMVPDSRGFGWYAWKPFIVCEEILKAKDGDIIIYADAGQTLVNNVQHVVNAMDSDVFLFSNGWPHVEWCKMDTLAAILPDSDWGTSADSTMKQVQASLQFYRVSEESRNFVKEWLAWSLMPGLIDNSPSKLPHYPTFAEHRWDQSILGCLQIKYSYPLHWFPTTTAHHLDKGGAPYPEITLHHRKRNNEW
jgi:hypothetical protein